MEGYPLFPLNDSRAVYSALVGEMHAEQILILYANVLK